MRLIEANALMKTLIHHSYLVKDYWNTRERGMFLFGIEQAINEQPTVDAVPVIRCKDCKHKNEYGYCTVYPSFHHLTADIDYCSDAERKEE